MFKLDSKFKEAESLFDDGKIKSARSYMEKLREECVEAGDKALCDYNLGSLFWTHIGDGEKAREYYRSVASVYEDSGRPAELLEMAANSIENLMLLSKSFDEFDMYSEKLRSLQPTNDILRGLIPEAVKLKEKGFSWYEVLEVFTQMYYNRNDPAQDQGRYGNAASNYQIILAGRREFRVSYEAVSRIAIEYGYTKYKLLTGIINKQTQRFGDPIQDEFQCIVDETLDLINSCFIQKPPSEDVKKVMEVFENFRSLKESTIPESNKGGSGDKGSAGNKDSLPRNTVVSGENKELGQKLIDALKESNPEEALKMIGDGADVNFKSADDLTALRIAAQLGYTEVVLQLLKHGARTDEYGAMYGWTPLMLAAYAGNSDVVKLFVEYGADVNQTDFQGSTALMILCSEMECRTESHYETAEYLIEKGTRLNAKNKSGWDAMLLSKMNGNRRMVIILSNKGVPDGTNTFISKSGVVLDEGLPLYMRNMNQKQKATATGSNPLKIFLPILGPAAAILAYKLAGVYAMLVVLAIAFILFIALSAKRG